MTTSVSSSIDEKYLQAEITEDFSEIGLPELNFTFKSVQNMKTKEANAYTRGLALLEKKQSKEEDPDPLEVTAFHIATLIVSWNLKDDDGTIFEVPTLEDSPQQKADKLSSIRRRQIEYMIWVMLQYANTDPLVNLLLGSVNNL